MKTICMMVLALALVAVAVSVPLDYFGLIAPAFMLLVASLARTET